MFELISVLMFTLFQLRFWSETLRKIFVPSAALFDAGQLEYGCCCEHDRAERVKDNGKVAG